LSLQKQDLKKDLKKILPIWAGILSLIIIGVAVLRIFSLNIINYLEYPEMNPGQMAQAFLFEGEKYWLKCLKKVEKNSKTTGKFYLSKEDPDYKKVVELFEKSLSFIPQNSTIYRHLGDLATFNGDQILINYFQGMTLFYENRPLQAIEYFNKVLELKPDHLPSIEKIAQAYLDKNRDIRAENFINMYLKYSPDSGRASYLQGYLSLLRNNLDDAIRFFKTAIEKDPKFLDSYSFLANCLESKNRIDEACEVFKKATEQAPGQPTYLHRLGLSYLKANKPEKARDALLKALKLYPNHPRLCFDLAKAYQKLGKKSYSSYYLKKALELDPSLQNEILK